MADGDKARAKVRSRIREMIPRLERAATLVDADTDAAWRLLADVRDDIHEVQERLDALA